MPALHHTCVWLQPSLSQTSASSGPLVQRSAEELAVELTPTRPQDTPLLWLAALIAGPWEKHHINSPLRPTPAPSALRCQGRDTWPFAEWRGARHPGWQLFAAQPQPAATPPREAATGESKTMASYPITITLYSKKSTASSTVTDELGTCGLTTPFLFSSLAPDINSSGARRLVQVFLRMCLVPCAAALNAEHTWREEARFASPAELTMGLR
ncbi:hypothetical protein BC826DRAFT_1113119 [Russula brevipes]|nr:hypothetical protein BC826DRAFT_1113119 [Russula brevipes]